MRLREDLVLRHIGGDRVIVDPGQDMVDMSKVFTLNETAAWLWQELAGTDFELENVVNMLAERYDVSREVAQNDARQLLAIFREHQLVED